MANTFNLKIGSTTPSKLMFGDMPQTSEYVYPGGNEVWDAYLGDTLVWHKDKTLDNYLIEYNLGTRTGDIFTITNNTGINKPLYVALDATFYNGYAIDFKYNTEISTIVALYLFETIFRNSTLNYNPDLSYKWYRSNIGDINQTYYINFSDVSNRFPSNNLNLRAMFMNSNIGSISFNTNVPIENMINFCSECYDLTEVDTSSVIFISNCNFGSAFRNCSSLSSFTWDYENQVASLNNMFEDCTSLTTITSGSSNSVFKGTDFTEMFLGCSSLQSIPITIDASGLTSLVSSSGSPTKLTDIFDGCTRLQTFTMKFPEVQGSGGSWVYELDKSSTSGGDSPTVADSVGKVQLGNLSSMTQTTAQNLISNLPMVSSCAIVLPSQITATSTMIQTAGQKGWLLYKGSQVQTL